MKKVQHGLWANTLFQTYIWCCATNVLGRECTNLYTIGNPTLRLIFIEVNCMVYLSKVWQCVFQYLNQWHMTG